MLIKYSDLIFTKIFHGGHHDRVNGVIWSRGKKMHFKVQKSPNEGKTKSNHILCVIVHKFSVIHDTSLLLAEILMEISQDLINGVSWSRGANK